MHVDLYESLIRLCFPCKICDIIYPNLMYSYNNLMEIGPIDLLPRNIKKLVEEFALNITK